MSAAVVDDRDKAAPAAAATIAPVPPPLSERWAEPAPRVPGQGPGANLAGLPGRYRPDAANMVRHFPRSPVQRV